MSAISASTQGTIHGTVAVGIGNVVIGSIHGGVVNITQPPTITPRPEPPRLPPPLIPDLLDRQSEINQARVRLSQGQPVALTGPPGIGKSSLLGHLAVLPELADLPDGVLYLPANGQALDDLQQALFDAFYDSSLPTKPSPLKIRLALQEKRCLVLVDDAALERTDLESLLGAAPHSTFVLAGETLPALAAVDTLRIAGLPETDCLILAARRLGSALPPDELKTIRSLAVQLGGNPQALIQAIEPVRRGEVSLADLAGRAQSAQPGTAALEMLRGVLARLTPTEQRILALLAALPGASLGAEHIAPLSGDAQPGPAIESLLAQGLIAAHSPRYSLAGGLPASLLRLWKLDYWQNRLLDYFTPWAESPSRSPGEILAEQAALLRVLRWAFQQQRWAAVLRLGKAIEGALALGLKWGAWLTVLRWMLEAARQLGNAAAQAYALHQLGTRHLCLDEAQLARQHLTEALGLRESLGDQAGAAVTRHNLGLLPPPPQVSPPPAGKAGFNPLWLIPIGLLVVAGFVGFLFWRWLIYHPPEPEPSAPPPLATVHLTPTWSVTPSPSPTWTETPTPTPTPSPIPTLPPTPTDTFTPSPIPTTALDVKAYLDKGCDVQYPAGAAVDLLVSASLAGSAEIYLDGGYLNTHTVDAWQEQASYRALPMTAGNHTFEIVFYADDGQKSSTICAFDILAPAPTIDAYLDSGCSVQYTGGSSAVLYYKTNLDGIVDVYLDNILRFSGLQAMANLDMYVQENLPDAQGSHAYEIYFTANDGQQAKTYCQFDISDVIAPPVPVPILIGVPLTGPADYSTLTPICIDSSNDIAKLTWQPVSDPSGIKYLVELEKCSLASSLRFWSPKCVNQQSYSTARTKVTITSEVITLPNVTSIYRWKVAGIDGGNNQSAYSNYFYFSISCPGINIIPFIPIIPFKPVISTAIPVQ